MESFGTLESCQKSSISVVHLTIYNQYCRRPSNHLYLLFPKRKKIPPLIIMVNDYNFSLEFFPPDTTEKRDELIKQAKILSRYKPRFVSVTYGADGSTQDRTHKVIDVLKNELNLHIIPHLTCVGSSKEKIQSIANSYWQKGFTSIVALRGDKSDDPVISDDQSNYYHFAVDLTIALKQLHNFTIFTAGYPEIHPEAPNKKFDLDNLKKKVDAGAQEVLTQFFYNNDYFLRYRDDCQKIGIDIPITPGILPISNLETILSFATKCGTEVPQVYFEQFNSLDDEKKDAANLGIELALRQIEDLRSEGVNKFHLYTLNRRKMTEELIRHAFV